MTRTLASYGKKKNLFKDLVPSGEDFREGLTAVIALRVPEPKFEAQTKVKLGNSEVEGIVNSAGRRLPAIATWRKIPRRPRSIVQKGAAGGRGPRERPQGQGPAPRTQGRPLRRRIARQAARLHQPRRRDAASCTWSRVIRPAAAPKGAACANIQAILPLRGKIINAYKSREDKVLANEEVRSMISAIGSGIGEEIDLSKRRYSKIVIMTDADVDGSHIRTLLLTFFYRQMYQLVRRALSTWPSRRCSASKPKRTPTTSRPKRR